MPFLLGDNMIITASIRTDIPAFYSEWFINRFKAGYVLTKNPYNSKQVKHIDLNPSNIDAIIFWTKNAQPLLPKLHHLDGFNYYFQYTLNPYGKDIESNVPPLKDRINTFISLSNQIGKDKVIWRYDPILLTKTYTIEYHIKTFETMIKQIHNHTSRIIISFIDEYMKIKDTLKQQGIKLLTTNEMKTIAKAFSLIAKKYNLNITTCAETINLEQYGIKHGKCIDNEEINKLFNKNIIYTKAKYQRDTCLCHTSIDIGSYNTCPHMCKYCYANYDHNSVKKTIKQHDPTSPFLIGTPTGDEQIDELKKDLNLFCF
jgi:hypothetical protein